MAETFEIASVSLQCDESADFQTFRLGLFGLDKLSDIDRTLANLEEALKQIHNFKASGYGLEVT
jgi:aspartate aminotransferase-like enzyme